MGQLLFYLRSAVSVVVLSGCAIYGVVASAVLTLCGKQRLAQWTTARCFYHAVRIIFGIDVEVQNEHYLKNLPFIVVSNHQSTFDIFMLGRMFPQGCTVTAKKSLKYVPFLGWFMALSGTLFLDRSNRERSVTVLSQGLAKVKRERRALWIFPEGTRSYTDKLEILPFKKGAFHLAVQGGIPIVPVVVSNTSTIMNPRWGVFNRGKITVRVLEPISTEGMQPEDVGPLCNRVHDLMQEELLKVGYSSYILDTNIPSSVKDSASSTTVQEPEIDSSMASGAQVH